jgi:hypothetical protein
MADLSSTLAAALGTTPQSPTSLMAAVEQILQPSQSELFFCGLPVLVEGLEDISFVATHLKLSGRWADFRRLGGHFVIAEGKTNLSRPLAMANSLGIPAFVIFDGDRDRDGKQEQERNQKDNGCILRLCGMDDTDPLSDSVVWGERVVMWPTRIGAEIQREIGEDIWAQVLREAEVKHGLVGVRRKSGLLIAAAIECLWEKGVRSEQLERVCAALIDFGNKLSKAPGSVQLVK